MIANPADLSRSIDDVLEDFDAVITRLIEYGHGNPMLDSIADKLILLVDELGSGIVYELDFNPDDETEH